MNNLNHPFHLHGNQLFVIEMGQDEVPMTVSLAKLRMRTRSLMTSSVKKHAIKDTISIPSKGFTVLRFKADNPGWWLLHCHYGKKNIFNSSPASIEFFYRMAFGGRNGACAASWRT